MSLGLVWPVGWQGGIKGGTYSQSRVWGGCGGQDAVCLLARHTMPSLTSHGGYGFNVFDLRSLGAKRKRRRKKVLGRFLARKEKGGGATRSPTDCGLFMHPKVPRMKLGLHVNKPMEGGGGFMGERWARQE